MPNQPITTRRPRIQKARTPLDIVRASIAHRARHCPPALQVARRIRAIELAIEEACTTAGIPVPGKTHKGRRLNHAHPLPRREFLTWQEKQDGPEQHHPLHTNEYVTRCHHCYMREYMYFRNHPEERPVYDGYGYRRKKRPWIDKGWEKDWKDEMPWKKGGSSTK